MWTLYFVTYLTDNIYLTDINIKLEEGKTYTVNYTPRHIPLITANSNTSMVVNISRENRMGYILKKEKRVSCDM